VQAFENQLMFRRNMSHPDSSETPADFQRATRRYITEDRTIQFSNIPVRFIIRKNPGKNKAGSSFFFFCKRKTMEYTRHWICSMP
jgi:hypothetical protein